MKNLIVLILIFFGWGSEVLAQQSLSKVDTLEGKVTFLTSDNIYLGFDQTDRIQVGDTLFKKEGEKLIPVLTLYRKSSVSVIAKPLPGRTFKVGEIILALAPKPEEKKPESSPEQKLQEKAPSPKQTTIAKRTPKKKETLRGTVAINNYSVISDSDFSSRSVARLSARADSINGSGLSFRTYARYRQNRIDRNAQQDVFGKFFLYEFAFDYQIQDQFAVTIGRFINRNMVSVGAIDGLKLEKTGRLGFGGVIAGFRPDPISYGLNTDLFQFGAFAGLYHNKSKSAFSSLGFIEQTNKKMTDRRYLYFQHQSNVSEKISLFASSELDLYQKDSTGRGGMSPRLSNLFFSVNYRVLPALNLSASYDVRRNFILYESFAEELDRLIRDDPYRTGLRLRANYRLAKYVRWGVAMSRRLQSDQKNEYSQINSSLQFSKIPGLKGSLMLMGGLNKNSYLSYQTFLARYSRDFWKGKVTIAPYGRYLIYSYFSSETPNTSQIYAGIDTNLDITKRLSFRLLYDYSTRNSIISHRFNINITQRF